MAPPCAGEVEAALLAIDGVRDVAVFGLDDRLGQIVAAAVVGTVDTAELAVDARASLSGYKVRSAGSCSRSCPGTALGRSTVSPRAQLA